MSARDTFQASVKSACQAQVATLITAAATKQETINASGVNVGYTTQTGNYANLAAAVKNANQASWLATFNAEHAKQVAINNARDALRDTGDKGSA